MRIRSAIGALLLVVTSATPASAAQDIPLQTVLDSARTALGLPGTAAAVILADGTHWEGASGLARPGSYASPRTSFELGSITKLHTATLVLGLAEKGRLGLGDRLEQWFPDLPGAGSITVRQLLSHTHGLHDPLQDPDFVPDVLANPTRVWTLEDLLKRMGDPHFEPGARWRYSNTGFHLLGAVVEAVTDSDFRHALEAHLLEPMGLRHTWYGLDDPEGADLAAAYIDPSGADNPQPVSLLMPWTAFRSSAGPAGAVVSTAKDTARFLHLLVTGRILSEAGWLEMTTWVDRPDGHRYGLGILRIEDGHRSLLGHKGNSAGYSAAAFHDLESGITVVVLANAHAVDVTPAVTALLRTALALSGPCR